MFVGIIGPLCAGKHSVAKWLISNGFVHLGLKQRDQTGLETVFFDKSEDILNYVTKHWAKNFVICNIESMRTLEMFKKRPFFMLIAVDSPITTRYIRYVNRCRETNNSEPTIEEFITRSDCELYNIAYPIIDPSAHMNITICANLNNHQCLKSPIINMMQMANLNVINSYNSLFSLYEYLQKINVINEERLRPSWDTYFMRMSDLAASRSNCMKRKVGCILVKDCRVVATGYNGTPRGIKNCNEGGCQRCNDAVPCGLDLDVCLCLHAEENALLEAGRDRVSSGCILYCNTCPCLRCTVKLVQAGVKEVVYNLSYGMDDKTAKLLKEAGVILRQHTAKNICDY
ncbi:7452_t:CDS:2 [Ambispora gerdemannii]|uniref:Deoxycytidylate deaminase n=1 Tax=Ambispora gerdemannii TaxID=144530 RepID=A0A9N9BC38_9GLOM|nr:7452_t:CDS:2 [Ambispora gerdemannii]